MEYDNGARWEMPVHRWREHSDAVDAMLLSHCRGTTLDVGCGPGRLTLALIARGVLALGIDTSEAAVRMTVQRGGRALMRDVFGPVPGEQHWKHVLLADGNLGIGGDPKRLLERVRRLLDTDGSVIVEVASPGTGMRSRMARIDSGPWFRWCDVGVDTVPRLAESAGMRLSWTVENAGRWFAGMEPKTPDSELPVPSGAVPAKQ